MARFTELLPFVKIQVKNLHSDFPYVFEHYSAKSDIDYFRLPYLHAFSEMQIIVVYFLTSVSFLIKP